MHNESNNTFSQFDVKLELEEVRHGFQTDPSVYVTRYNQRGTSKFKLQQHDKAVILEKLNLKREDVLTWKSEEARQKSPK